MVAEGKYLMLVSSEDDVIIDDDNGIIAMDVSKVATRRRRLAEHGIHVVDEETIMCG